MEALVGKHCIKLALLAERRALKSLLIYHGTGNGKIKYTVLSDAILIANA